MRDPWNPTPAEIETWAFDAESGEPSQDWDLTLRHVREESLFLQLASDERCPKRRFFLHMLYLIVGDSVRAKFRGTPQPIIEGFVARGAQYSHPDIEIWVRRAKQLLKDPSTFRYDDWCAGKYAAPPAAQQAVGADRET